MLRKCSLRVSWDTSGVPSSALAYVVGGGRFSIAMGVKVDVDAKTVKAVPSTAQGSSRHSTAKLVGDQVCHALVLKVSKIDIKSS